MKKLGSAIALLFAGVALNACAADTQDPETGAPENVGTSKDEILASVDVGYGTVAFHKITNANGSMTTFVSEDSPANYKTSPFDSVAYGHTALEMFLAVAPGEEPPQELVDAQARSAERLGRASDAIVVPSFDRDAPIEKSNASCNDWAWYEGAGCPYYTHTNKAYETASNGGDHSLYVGDDNDYMTTSAVTLAACNESNDTILTKLSIDTDGDSDHSTGDLVHGSQIELPAGWKRRYVAFDAVPQSCEIVNNTLVCHDAQVRYRIRGYADSGKLYRLRTSVTGSYDAPWCIR